jgi:hypothetical protein
MSVRERDVVEQVDIDAPRERVWAAVSDPAAYRRWSPESTGMRRLDGERGEPWTVGQRFVGSPGGRCGISRIVTTRTPGGLTVDFALPRPRASAGGAARRAGAERWRDARGCGGAVMRPAGLLVGGAPARNRATMRDAGQPRADLPRPG